MTPSEQAPDRAVQFWTSPRRRRFRLSGCCLLLGVVLCAESGCATTKPYSPDSLPARLRARPTSNVRTVGLTQLASDSKPLDELGVGDSIEVNIVAGLTSDESTTFVTRLDDSGRASIPHVGQVRLQNMTLEEAETVIKVACIQQGIFRDPHVAVTLKQRKMINVTVVGAVEEEGSYILSGGSSGLLQAIANAGGFSKDAGTNVEIRYPDRPASSPPPLIAQAGGSNPAKDFPYEVTPANGEIIQTGVSAPIRTSGARTVTIDLASMEKHNPSDLELSDGAVVMVERRDPQPLQVLGLVNKPDVYEYPVGKNLRLLDAIAIAGGTSSLVADKVFVIRRRPEMQEPALIQVSMRKAKRNGEHNLILEPGDTVTVEQTPGTVFLESIRMIGFNVGAAVF